MSGTGPPSKGPGERRIEPSCDKRGCCGRSGERRMKSIRSALAVIFFLSPGTFLTAQVRTTSGMVEGTTSPDGKIQIYKGIPYAAPPEGALRWKEPQPPQPWEGLRKATEFGPRCMQGR